jgi:hypothetical protein
VSGERRPRSLGVRLLVRGHRTESQPRLNGHSRGCVHPLRAERARVVLVVAQDERADASRARQAQLEVW